MRRKTIVVALAATTALTLGAGLTGSRRRRERRWSRQRRTGTAGSIPVL